MTPTYFALPAEDEAELDSEARAILSGLRELSATAALRPDQTSARCEERHLRLRLEPAPRDWLDLLVGDGYTEIRRSDGGEYSGYLNPPQTIAFVRERLSKWTPD